MAVTYSQIDQYLLMHIGRASDADENLPLLIITCRYQDEVVGYIHFYLKGSVPDSEIQLTPDNPPKEIIRVNLGINRITEVLNTLRYEKPVNFGVFHQHLTGFVGTAGVEPVGEEES